jgi:hypothetical protein
MVSETLTGEHGGRRTRNKALRGEGTAKRGSIVRWPSLLDNARLVAHVIFAPRLTAVLVSGADKYARAGASRAQR